MSSVGSRQEPLTLQTTHNSLTQQGVVCFGNENDKVVGKVVVYARMKWRRGK